MVIPNWERLSLFPADAEPPPRWPGYDDLAIGDRALVLYLGNTGVGHRFDTVLAAAERLADDAVFLFVGGGQQWAALQAEVRGRGLPNVVFRAYVPKDDTPAVMAGADLALITLHDRSLGVMSPSKLHANLAAGLPVLYVGPVGSNVDEAIARFAAGRSLREGDVEGVVAAVRELRTDTTARARAREAFEAAYSRRGRAARLRSRARGLRRAYASSVWSNTTVSPAVSAVTAAGTGASTSRVLSISSSSTASPLPHSASAGGAPSETRTPSASVVTTSRAAGSLTSSTTVPGSARPPQTSKARPSPAA